MPMSAVVGSRSTMLRAKVMSGFSSRPAGVWVADRARVDQPCQKITAMNSTITNRLGPSAARYSLPIEVSVSSP